MKTLRGKKMKLGRFEISIAGFVAFLLIASVASAAVLGYYGVMEGTADVEGPIFYGTDSHDLLTNTKPSAGHIYQFSGVSPLILTSDDLDNKDFNYTPKCNFSLKVNSTSSGQHLNVSCRYSDGSENHTICTSTLTNIGENPEVRVESCLGDSLSGVKYFIYEFEAINATDYWIETNATGNTKLGVKKG